MCFYNHMRRSGATSLLVFLLLSWVHKAIFLLRISTSYGARASLLNTFSTAAGSEAKSSFHPASELV